MAYLLTELPCLGKTIHFFNVKFDEDLRYAIDLSAIYKKKVLTDNVLKILKLFCDF